MKIIYKVVDLKSHASLEYDPGTRRVSGSKQTRLSCRSICANEVPTNLTKLPKDD